MRKIRCFLIGESKRKKERGKSSGTISSLQRYVFFETADLFLRMTMSLVSLLLLFFIGSFSSVFMRILVGKRRDFFNAEFLHISRVEIKRSDRKSRFMFGK